MASEVQGSSKIPNSLLLIFKRYASDCSRKQEDFFLLEESSNGMILNCKVLENSKSLYSSSDMLLNCKDLVESESLFSLRNVQTVCF